MLNETVQVVKTVIDSGTVLTAIAAFITNWVPPLLLLLALGWWLMRYWEIVTGRNISDIFKPKKRK